MFNLCNIQGSIEQLAITDNPLAASQQCSPEVEEETGDIVSLIFIVLFKNDIVNEYLYLLIGNLS